MMAEATDLFVLKEWLENRKLDVAMKPHPMAVADSCECIMSTHQLFVSGPKGRISVVRGGLSLGEYEICCLEGDLFDYVCRYRDVKSAGLTIDSLLTTGAFPLEPDDANQSGEP